MKVRGATEKDCRKCREKLWLDIQYDVFANCIDSVGKDIREVDVKKTYEERLGIDFNKIECHYETKAAFMKRVRKETKENE